MKTNLFLPIIVGALALLSIFIQKSQADIEIKAQQEATGGVIFTYTGSLRQSELGSSIEITPIGEVSPYSPKVEFAPNGGGSAGDADWHYNAVSSRPSAFGNGNTSYPSTFTGDYFGIDYWSVILPDGYGDNDPIEGTMTFDGATFTSMGLTHLNGAPYVWILSNGESVSLIIDNTVTNIAEKVALQKQIKKIKIKLNNAKFRGKKRKAKKFKKKLRELQRRLKTL